MNAYNNVPTITYTNRHVEYILTLNETNSTTWTTLKIVT